MRYSDDRRRFWLGVGFALAVISVGWLFRGELPERIRVHFREPGPAPVLALPGTAAGAVRKQRRVGELSGARVGLSGRRRRGGSRGRTGDDDALPDQLRASTRAPEPSQGLASPVIGCFV